MTALPHSTAVPPFGRDINVLLFFSFFLFLNPQWQPPLLSAQRERGPCRFLTSGLGYATVERQRSYQ